MATVVERIGGYAEHLAFKHLDAETLDYTKRLLLDGIGCALGGLQGEPVRIIRDTIEELGGSPQTTLFGQGKKANSVLAALANGVSLRYLDFNDVYLGPAWAAHPSDMIAALFAVAECYGRSGEDFLTAMVLAYELQIGFSDLPLARNLSHEGWDHSGSCAYASAAGAAKLLGLDAAGIAHAIALSGARANTLSQIRVGDISMEKALSAPVAAANSILYALLAKRGFTACPTPLEGKYGFSYAVAKGVDMEQLVPEKGRYAINKVGMKSMPVETHTTAMVEAALELRKQHNVRPEEIESILILTHEEVLKKPTWSAEKFKPTTRETADHSGPYCVAVALINGEVTARQFTDEWLQSDTVAKLIGVTQMQVSAELTEYYKRGLGQRLAAVKIKTTRGMFSCEIRHPLGESRNPMMWDHVIAKFVAQAEPVLGTSGSRRVIEQVRGTEKISDMGLLAETLGRSRGGE